jgi:hypothetical protein
MKHLIITQEEVFRHINRDDVEEWAKRLFATRMEREMFVEVCKGYKDKNQDENK